MAIHVDKNTMANVAVINAVGLSPRALRPIREGKSALDWAISFAKGLPEAGRVIVLANAADDLGAAGEEVEVRRRDRFGLRDLLEELDEAGREATDLFYFYGDCPLLDPVVAQRMHENHRKYFAEYTFADGFPEGFTPEIVQGTAVRHISRMLTGSDNEIARDSLFTLIQRDINSFDIETEIAAADLRLLRLRLACDTERNTRIVEKLIDAGCRDEASLLEILPRRGDLLRSLPAYFEIQITEGVTQEVSYSPYPQLVSRATERRGEMPYDSFVRLLDQIRDLAGDAVVSPSLWGEPALHSRVGDICSAVTEREGLKLLIETSGVGWRDGVLEEIAGRVGNRIMWIVDLDASNPALYEKLRGKGWEEAQAATERLIALFPGNVHVQSVRTQANEDDLEQFYKIWKEKASNVIIQKYDWFCGALPQLKVTDLSPLHRFPCWHLKRDMIILLDGTVPMCREDLACEYLLGNAFEEPLAAIWERGAEYHLRHVREDYPRLCVECDEYYTYNF